MDVPIGIHECRTAVAMRFAFLSSDPRRGDITSQAERAMFSQQLAAIRLTCAVDDLDPA